VIPNPWELEYVALGRWLERARDARDRAYAEAREVCGEEISLLDNEELLELALELPESVSVCVLHYLNARLWQEQLIDQRLERAALHLNGNGALIERCWNVAAPRFTEMHGVYVEHKARYHRTREE